MEYGRSCRRRSVRAVPPPITTSIFSGKRGPSFRNFGSTIGMGSRVVAATAESSKRSALADGALIFVRGVRKYELLRHHHRWRRSGGLRGGDLRRPVQLKDALGGARVRRRDGLGRKNRKLPGLYGR